MDQQSQPQYPNLGASATTFSWVEATDPNAFGNPNPDEAVAYTIADDVSMPGRSETVTSNNNNNLRVYVRLASGARILIPIAQTATVDELHAEVVRRAAKLGGPVSMRNSVLETTGHNASILFGEDLLRDVMDTTENFTFSVTSLDLTLNQGSETGSLQSPRLSVDPNIPSTSSKLATETSGSPYTSSATGGKAKVYIRWITQRAALDVSYLRDLPIKCYPYEDSISVSDLKLMAAEQLDLKLKIDLDVHLRAQDLVLFLSDCYLSDAPESTFTVASLAPEGTTRQTPINIFISTNRVVDRRTKAQGNWGFECTDRSASTFITSLKIMMSEIRKQRVKLHNLLDILWTITHFPPALLSFQELYENIIPDDVGSSEPQSAAVRALSILAESFWEISQKMVPPWISKSPDTLLESSRQIFAWWHTLSAQAELVDGDTLTLVHSVQLMDVTSRDKVGEIEGRFKHNELVDIKGADNLVKKKFLVSLMTMSHTSPHRLAHALNGAEDYFNYYFNLPDNTQGLLEHKRVSCLHPTDFDNLLETTSQVSGFRMVGPLQLASCLSSDLPIITLDSAGFVSTYGQNTEFCGDGSYFTCNAISGREAMSDTNPGQYLLQKLNPIMLERKKDRTWEVDAWSEIETINDMSNPEEAIVICVDTSASMGTEMGPGWVERQPTTGDNLLQNQISRLAEVKDVFKNMVSRISAYNLPTHLGLVTFSQSVTISQPLTPILLNFQNRLDGTAASGPTAIFDAIHDAKTMLMNLKARHPDMKTRIVVLTDGEDNSSVTYPWDICRDLYSTDIVLDAIVIGTNLTSDLFKLAKHTGGYAFCPKTRSALFQIFLLETFIDLKTRPAIFKPALVDYFSTLPKAADMQTPFDFPPCRPHPNQEDHFSSLSDANQAMAALSRRDARAPSSGYARSEVTARSGSTWDTNLTAGTSATLNSSSSNRLVLTEIKSMIETQHQYIDVYVSDSNMGFWKVVMQGPPASPYEDGTFLLYIELGDQFPRKAPTARFITPILHPNVTKHGRICHPIFDREWTPATRIYQVIQQLWGILMSLEARDAIDPLFTLKFWTDPESGRREVKQYVQRFALPSRAAHRANILNGTSLSSLTPSAASSSPPPSYRTNPPTHSPTVLSSHLLSLRRSGRNSSSGSGSPVFTPPSTASNASSTRTAPRAESRASSTVGSAAELLPAGNAHYSASVASSTGSSRRRLWGRLQGRH